MNRPIECSTVCLPMNVSIREQVKACLMNKYERHTDIALAFEKTIGEQQVAAVPDSPPVALKRHNKGIQT
ncbi:hypothetical protein [Paenibacillus sp. FJAT-26967]|uniref:hypothetical protein n=1 Tax=Paenibacillus sp. FJAT-26967 TaxID=1729690 RepID=UPI000A7996DD|nr:hypothetical protein [Paenibacillus sp. FJAT-26967]